MPPLSRSTVPPLSRKRRGDSSWERPTSSKIARVPSSASSTQATTSENLPRDKAETNDRRLPSNISSSKVQTHSRTQPSTQQNSQGHHGFPQTREPPNGGVPRLIPENVVALPRGAPFTPEVRHAPHPDSKLCQDFHWIPYPLGLMPYDSWHKLHYPDSVQPPLPFRCSLCKSERKTTAHIRKIFLVAERLTWQFGEVPLPDKERNEELTWAVNYELGILDPAMEDPVQYLGGRKSQTDRFYPYQNEHEMKLALKYIFASEDITQVSWSLWIGMQMDLEKMFSVQAEPSTKPATPNPISGTRRPLDSNNRSRPKTPDIEEIDLTVSPDHASRKPTRRPTFGISTPPSCYSKNENKAQSLPCPKSTTPSTQAPSKSTPGPASAVQHTQPAPYFGKDRRIVSYKTLQDFYSLLDRIERTSYVGALFLEAYAERLQRVQCSNCYAQRYIDLDDPFVE